jgi:integrase
MFGAVLSPIFIGLLHMKQAPRKNPDHNLRLRNGWFYAVRSVPPKAIPAMGGKDKLVISLDTQMIAEARRLRDIQLGLWQAEFDALKRGEKARKDLGLAFDAAHLAEAKRYGEEMRKALDRGADAAWSRALNKKDERSFSLEAKHGKSVGSTFFLASHGSVPIIEHLERWLAEKRYGAGTRGEFRTAIKRLLNWLAENEKSLTVHIDKDEAVQFKLDVLSNANPVTANKLLTGLRAYWTWLVKHGFNDENPWIGLSFPKRDAMPDERERSFTDDEVMRLFAGDPDRMMRDVMGIGALSGMRLEEIFQLRVKHCGADVFQVHKSKTKAGLRDVPIHSALVQMIATRSAGKNSDDYLIDEDGTTASGRARSMSFSKRFATYRRTCGVDAKIDGHRRSKVNFHSFRRWAITKADQAGKRREDVERTFGHKVQGMSFGHYSAGSLMTQLRDVIECVTLPAGIIVHDEARPFQKVKPVLRTKNGQVAKRRGHNEQTAKNSKRGRKAKGA